MIVGPLFNLDMRSDKETMPFDVKDLESELTLRALSNRWCSYFNMARRSEGYRFNIFKENVRLIYERRGADPKKLEANHLCDVTIDELCPPKVCSSPLLVRISMNSAKRSCNSTITSSRSPCCFIMCSYLLVHPDFTPSVHDSIT